MAEKVLNKFKIGKNSTDIFRVQDNTKQMAHISVTDTTSTTKSVDIIANTDYHFGTLTSLELTSVEVSDLESNIFFTSGETIQVTFPSTLKLIGEIEFNANTSYVLSILNNAIVMGEITEQTVTTYNS